MNLQKVLIVGLPGPEQLGSHFAEAAEDLGVHSLVEDFSAAFSGPPVIRHMYWYCLNRLPYNKDRFIRSLLSSCGHFRPDLLLIAGLAPLTPHALTTIGNTSTKTALFLTDDPWNPAHRSPTFLRTLDLYDFVFCPRMNLLAEIKAAGARAVSFLPFGYSTRKHYPEPITQKEIGVSFVGAADRERVPFAEAMIRAGLRPALFGRYWDRYPTTRSAAMGVVDIAGFRHAIARSKVTVNLLRRANRDEHTMRTFELPAMKACFVSEYSQYHETLLGPDGNSTMYFSSPEELVKVVTRLLTSQPLRSALANAAYVRIRQTPNTYVDRIRHIIETVQTQ